MKHGLGLVIGKFYAPHRGDKFLIDRALAQSEQVTVIVCAKPTDSIPGERRQQWLQESHPMARVMLIDDRYDETDSRIWGRWVNCSGVLRGNPSYGTRGLNHGPMARLGEHLPL